MCARVGVGARPVSLRPCFYSIIPVVLLFKPYTDSQKKWKHKYFYVVPASQSAVDAIGDFNEEGRLSENKFHLVCLRGILSTLP